MSLVLVIQNISKLAPISDYRYEVRVGDGSVARSETIARGVVTGHRRRDGWQRLVRQVLAQEAGETES